MHITTRPSYAAWREIFKKLMAAKWVFEQLSAMPDLEQVNRLLDREGNHETHGLSLRKLQVLCLVVSG